MPRLGIQDFRATLGGGTDRGVRARACRTLSPRPGLARGIRTMEWPTWPPAAAPEANG